MKRFGVLLLVTLACIFGITADEGMYPLSEIAKLNLKAKGLKISVKDLYNPDGVSLVDAICQVGGGTGEFVSAEGLILTNHHIAFDAVAAVSTPEQDYLKRGFTASAREMEIPAEGYTCRITEKYRDVSTEVLSVLKDDMQPAERSRAIREKMSELAKLEEGGRPNITCQVSEMFPGRSYVLFTYRLIKDVRLVYIPPIGVGNFGGEDDNWIWPRHTGDFSFLRAYVAPDGSTADYSKSNVPYKPKRFLKVAPKGVSEGDFVMVLGYPGRTYRHKTSHYLLVQQEVVLPFVSSRFDWMIQTLEEAGREDRGLQLKFADEIKSYANVTKNYKGKIQGLQRLNLVGKKRTEEQELQRFIDQDPARKQRFGTTLKDIAAVYDEYHRTARQELTLSLLNRNRLLALANTLLAAVESKDRSPEGIQKLQKNLSQQFDNIHVETERALLVGMLRNASTLPSDQQLVPLPKRRTVEEALAGSIMGNREALVAAATKDSAGLVSMDDYVMQSALALRSALQSIRERARVREGTLNRLEADLLDVKMQWQKKDFIPDANSTLRLTYGYIRGYSPADATRYSPITTLRGLVEKHRGSDPFDAPVQLLDLYNTRRYDASYEDPALKEVPVAILYNTDTSGGNSGSPVMNAYGELVGVNFDRAYEATINDYQWSESYSRSIGVDVRYVLFIAKYLGKADFLLRELGIR